MSIYGDEFAERLRELRKSRGFTQYSLADALHTKRQNIQGYESGLKFPKYEMLVQMCDLLGVSADYMLGRNVEAPAPDSASFLMEQMKGLQEPYNNAPRERQRTVDAILKDIYVIVDAALKSTSDREIGLYIDLFDVARRIMDATHSEDE